jgi:hypothetical protein
MRQWLGFTNFYVQTTTGTSAPLNPRFDKTFGRLHRQNPRDFESSLREEFAPLTLWSLNDRRA